jgi:diacylglycerol kinase
MKKQQTFIQSVKHALNGMTYFFLHERNGKLQLCIAITVVTIAVGLGVSTTEWGTLLLCIAFVISAEMVNSAIERLCDVVQEEYHPVIKIVKDVAAGAVLFISIVAVIIGCIIFFPKLIYLF